MASLRLTFPEKDQPTVIAITGARLTIGRLPFNTIQIIDRTVSGFHAELISEHGHYRLHDRGSSNGTFVNGQRISDYHLSEACVLSFGTFEAHFSPEDLLAEEAETFPSRGEVNAVRQENIEMRATVTALREEIGALRESHSRSNESGGETVSRAEYERVVAEREALKETQVRLLDEANRLKTDLAIVKRDRVNLQLAYDSAQRELETLRRGVSADESPALPPVEAAAILAAGADEVRIATPKKPLPPPGSIPGAAPTAPSVSRAEPSEEAPPVSPPTPPPEPLRPAPSLPGIPAAPVGFPKPRVPLGPAASTEAPPPKPAPTVIAAPAQTPAKTIPLPAKTQPFPPVNAPRPGPVSGDRPPAPSGISRPGVRPLPPPRTIPGAAAKPPGGPPAPKIVPAQTKEPGAPGPQGTQRISDPASEG